MSRVHEVLRWANRRDVAREVTRRGYRVSGETLNRWVRDEAEFPAVVERIVYDLFTIDGVYEKAAPPEWAERLEMKLDDIRQNQDRVADQAAKRLIEALAPPDRIKRVGRLIDQLEVLPPQGDVTPPASDEAAGQAEESPADRDRG